MARHRTASETKLPSFSRELQAWERWMRKHCDVVEPDLALKHERMVGSPFAFLRATYFRWPRIIEAVCPDIAGAPAALCVGDVHVENFGTWRDTESRLVWGVNDFDEAAVMPFAADLVRLCTSALLVPGLRLPPSRVSEAICEGYLAGLAAPAPLFVDERDGPFRDLVSPTARSNRKFWDELDASADVEPPARIRRALRMSLPQGAKVVRHVARVKGLGGLGRPRYVVLAHWDGGRVLREARAVLPSSWHWAHGANERTNIIDAAYGPWRAPDPTLRRERGHVLRRVGPDIRKIDISDLGSPDLTAELLRAMAADLAGIHAGSRRVKRMRAFVEAMGAKGLLAAAQVARDAVEADFAQWTR